MKVIDRIGLGLLSAIAISLAVPPWAGASQLHVQHYSRYLTMGKTQTVYGVQYSISVHVKDIDKARNAVKRIAKKFKGESISTNQQYQQANRSYTTVSFVVKKSKGDGVCKSLIDIGKLKSFTAQETFNKKTYDQLKGRIDALDEELASREEVLEGMAVTKEIMGRILANMKSQKDGIEKGRDLARVNVSLVSEK